MKVTLDFQNRLCRVVRQDGDKYMNESRLLYHVKQTLQKRGFDVIKKLAWKDGNMVSDNMHWIRTRKYDENFFAIYNDRYQIVDAGQEFWEMGSFDFLVVK